MEFEDIANLVNQAAIERKGRPLKDVERLVLEGAWHHQTYGTMAAQAGGYTEDYLKKDVGPKLWRLLSDLIDYEDIKVTKRNIQNVLQHWAAQRMGSISPSQDTTMIEADQGVSPPTLIKPKIPLALEVRSSTRLDASEFVGRSEDLEQLLYWLQDQGYRSIFLWGLPGIGKTPLLTRLMEILDAGPVPVGYLRLKPGLTDDDFFSALLTWLQAVEPEVSAPVVDAPSWIMQRFERRRYILLVDQLETLFQSGQPAGTFCPEASKTHQFFRQVAEQLHQSSVIWGSREKPLDLAQIPGGQIRIHQLADLSLEAIRHLLQGRKLTGLPPDWQALFERYGGNPLLLKGIAATVKEVYQGQVATFLSAQDPGIPSSFQGALEQVFRHLSPEETIVLYWLALAHTPVSMETLMAGLVPAPKALAVQSLLGRGLCCSVAKTQATETALDLPPIVRSWVLEQLRSTLKQDLLHDQVELFHRVPLVTTTAWEEIQAQQRHAILYPLATELRSFYPTEPELTQKMQRLHQSLMAFGPTRPGYGAGNFIHLCQALDVSVSGVSFAGLTIWQGDLRHVNLQGTNFSRAKFADTRFATALGRHPIMAFSADGESLATGDQKGHLLLWELDQGRLVKVLDDELSQGIQTLAFSPRNDLLAVGTDLGQIWLWPLTGGYHPDRLAGQQTSVLTLAFSPDGGWLAAGDAQGQVYLWDLASGELQGPWQRHQGAIHSLGFDSLGKTLLSGGDDQRICLGSLADSETVREFQAGPTVQMRTAAFIADPQWPDRQPRPVAVGYDEQTLTLWDVNTGQPHWAVPTEGQGILAVALDARGRYLVCSYQDFSVALWSLPQHQLCYRLPPFRAPVWALAFSPTGQEFSTAGDYMIQLWDSGHGTCLRSFLSQAHPVCCLALSQTGNQLLTGHEDYGLRLWPLAGVHAFTAYPRQLTGHTAAIRTVAACPLGKRFASSSTDLTIRLWRNAASSGCERVIAPLTVPADVLAFSPDGKWLASAGEDMAIALWNVNLGARFSRLEGHDSPVSALTFSADGQWLASGSRDGELRWWNIKQGHCRQVFLGHQGRIHSLALNQTGDILASIGYDGSLRWWSLTHGDLLGDWQHPEGHWLQAITLGPQDEILTITSQDYTVEIWNVANQRRQHRLEGHSQEIWQVALSPDRTTLATASQDDEIRIWQLETGSCLQVLRPDRPYEGANILGAEGLSPPEESMLKALGAVVRYDG